MFATTPYQPHSHQYASQLSPATPPIASPSRHARYAPFGKNICNGDDDAEEKFYQDEEGNGNGNGIVPYQYSHPNASIAAHRTPETLPAYDDTYTFSSLALDPNSQSHPQSHPHPHDYPSSTISADPSFSSSRIPYTPTFPSPTSLLKPPSVDPESYPYGYDLQHHIPQHPIIVQPDSHSHSPPAAYQSWDTEYHLKPSILPTPPMADEVVPLTQAGLKMDMNMAVEGSVAATPGIQTPLATYAAQMVVWLWFGNYRPPSPLTLSPASMSAANATALASDPFSSTTSSSLNPLQVQPSSSFTQFVGRLLQYTMVSHSVTLIALLYIYRLRLRHNIQGQAGSEQRPFVASLMLSNKYLDDNTYTNKTWAQVSGMTLEEINRMESEFLSGMNYDLGVKLEEYQHWRKLLDGFIYSREREASLQLSRHRSSWTPTLDFTQIYPTPPSVPAAHPSFEPSLLSARARSASPQNSTSAQALQPLAYDYQYDGSHLYSPSGTRKRSAGDAFAADAPSSSAAVYEGLRLPTRKANFIDANAFSQYDMSVPASNPNPNQPLQSTASSLGRASSLNRQIARMPEHGHGGNNGRRGSVGQAAQPAFVSQPASQLVPTAAPTMPSSEQAIGQDWTGGPIGMASEDYAALIAPYHRPAQPQVIPPQHLVFYTLAAEPHPGQDGAPRKAILHYQDPSGAYAYAPYPFVQTAPLPIQPSHAQPLYAVPSATYPHSHASTPLLLPQQSQIPPHPQAQPISVRPSPLHMPLSSTTPLHSTYVYHSGQPAQPQPAQFANAGPPGYAYNPHHQALQQYVYAHPHPQARNRVATGTHHLQPVAVPVQATPMPPQVPSQAPWSTSRLGQAPGGGGAPGQGHMTRWSVGSDEYVYHPSGNGMITDTGDGLGVGQVAAGQKPYTTRSEWSSPLPGYGGFAPGWAQGQGQGQQR